MANSAFDRQILNTRERPLSSDINTAQSQLDRALREVLLQYLRPRASATSELAGTPVSLFLGDGFKVRASAVPDLSVTLSAGVGFQYLPGDAAASIGGVSGLDDLSSYKPLLLENPVVISGISPGPGGANSRIDIVEVRMNRVAGNASSRDVLNIGSGVFVPSIVNKTLSYVLDGSVGVVSDPTASTAAISYKMGIPGVTPAEPATTTGYVKIATLKIESALASVVRANIIDQRLIGHPYGMMPFSATFGVPSGATSPPTSVWLSAPPGVEMVVLKIGTLDRTRFQVWVVGGAFGATPRGNMQGVQIRSYAAGEFYTMNVVGTSFGVMNSTHVANLANPNIAGPATAFPVGTPYMFTEFYLTRQAAGVTDGAVADPAGIDVQGFLQRY